MPCLEDKAIRIPGSLTERDKNEAGAFEYPSFESGKDHSALDQVLREHLAGLQLAEQTPFPAGLEQDQAFSPNGLKQGYADSATPVPQVEHGMPCPEITLEP